MNSITIKTSHLLLILGLIILVVPPILALPAFWKFFDFSKAGPIGDTIGGITAPFINAIGAVLVFVAFKEQIKANNLIKEQQYFQHIEAQIHRLEDDFLNLPEVIDEIGTGLLNSMRLANNFSDFNLGKQKYYQVSKTALNKAIYSTTIFELAINMIEKTENNKEFLLKKIRTLYLVLYHDNYLIIKNRLTSVAHMESKCDLEVAELLLQINKLEDKFDLP